jgi:hypothetical protein
MAFSFRNLFQGDAPELPIGTSGDRGVARHNGGSTMPPHTGTSLLPFAATSPFSPAPAASGTSPFQQGEVPDLLSLGLAPGPFTPRIPPAAHASPQPLVKGYQPGAADGTSPYPSPSPSPFAICQGLQGDDNTVAKDQSRPGSPGAGSMPGFPAPSDQYPAQNMQPNKPLSSPFSLAEDAAQQAPASPTKVPQSIQLSLHSALKDIPAKDLGFEASRIPKEVEVEIPLSAIQPQLASGRAVVPISLIQAGCEERFRPAFVRANPNLLVELPIAEIFRALPHPKGPSAPASPPSPFSSLSDFAQPTAAAARAPELYEESINEGLGGAQLLGVQAKTETPASPGSSGQTTPPSAQPPASSGQERQLESAASLDQPQPQPPAEPITSSPSPPASFLPIAPQSSPQENPPAAATQYHAASPAQVEAAAQEAAPSLPSPPQYEPSPAPRSASPQLPGLQFGYDEDPDQIVLRALFASQIRFTPQSVVERCAALPGIAACATIREGKVIHHADDNSAAAEEFRLASPGVLRRVVDLTHELGLEDLDTFTIRAKVGTVSFFLKDGLCLAILHAAQDLPPGARERLIVISRELAKLSHQR